MTTNHQQNTTNHQYTATNHQQTTTNDQQTTTDNQQMNTRYQQTNTIGHSGTSNQKSDFSLLLPAPSNYKQHPDFEKHTLQCHISGEGGGGRGSEELSGVRQVSSINKRGVLIKLGSNKNILT